MKKILIFFTLLILPVTAVFAVSEGAAINSDTTPAPLAEPEVIRDYNVEIRFYADSSITVKEKIDYDFGRAQNKHGIYRDIPLSYKNRFGNFNLKISDILVTDESGSRIHFTAKKSSGNIRIKIGDSDILVSGLKTYVIEYRIKRAFLFFEDHDELYWNAIGPDWQVPIEKTEVSIFLPSEMTVSSIRQTCFAGDFDTTQPCADYAVTETEPGKTLRVNYRHDRLEAGQVFTVVFGLPKGQVRPIPLLQNILYYLSDNFILGLPILIFILCFAYWYRHGRDPKGRGTIITQFDVPDNLAPAEVSAIMDGRVQNLDISAEIVYLATKGYLKIHQIEDKGFLDKFSKLDNFILEKLKTDYSGLNDYQKELMKHFFEQKYQTTVEEGGVKITGSQLSKFKKDFASDLKEINNKIYELVVLNGYFTRNPNLSRGVGITIGTILGMASLFMFESEFGLSWILSFLVSAVIVFIFSYFMPQLTINGVEKKEYLLGLKQYLSVAEKDRLEFHNAPEKKPETFEKLLPFAMVFGVEKQWARQFEDIYRQSPDWYSGPSGARFSAVSFTDNMNSFKAASIGMMAKTTQAASHGSGFGGGGGGGGFGGGGGGSW